MTKGYGLCAAVVLAGLTVACSGGEGGGTTTATGPTSSTSGSSPTNQSCVPAAPGNLRVSVSGSTRVFNWDAVSSANDYFIQIGTASGASNLVDTNTTQTTYTWTGGDAGTYYARVYARNSCGSGPNSNQISFN